MVYFKFDEDDEDSEDRLNRLGKERRIDEFAKAALTMAGIMLVAKGVMAFNNGEIETVKEIAGGINTEHAERAYDLAEALEAERAKRIERRNKSGK